MFESGSKQRIDRWGVLICAHDEARCVGEVVRGALEQGAAEVLVVDDGSADGTAEVAEGAGAATLRNERNMGKGYSLRRGFEWLLERECEAILTLDGDGQHDPAEIPRFLRAYERTGIPFLIGNRMADVRGMPLARRWANRFMSRMLNRLTGVYLPDPPCGFRFLRGDVLPFVMSEENRFAFEFDLLIHAALRHVRMDSVRISTIYPAGSRSHVAPVRDAWLLLRAVSEHFPARRNSR